VGFAIARHGVLDVEIVDARYFVAGATFLLYLVCFYLFAGRAVLFTPRWLRDDMDWMKKRGAQAGLRLGCLLTFVYNSQLLLLLIGCIVHLDRNWKRGVCGVPRPAPTGHCADAK